MEAWWCSQVRLKCLAPLVVVVVLVGQGVRRRASCWKEDCTLMPASLARGDMPWACPWAVLLAQH